jgi:hypothetical protein
MRSVAGDRPPAWAANSNEIVGIQRLKGRGHVRLLGDSLPYGPSIAATGRPQAAALYDGSSLFRPYHDEGARRGDASQFRLRCSELPLHPAATHDCR